MYKIRKSPSKPSDSYQNYKILHMLLGFPLTAFLGAGVLDIVMWVQSGRYQNVVFWLLFAAALTLVLWLPVSLLLGYWMGHTARQSRWKRNQAGITASALASAKLYAISLIFIYILIYIMDGAKSPDALNQVILHSLLFGICAGAVGGIFALALPREMPDTVHVSTHKAATRQPEN